MDIGTVRERPGGLSWTLRAPSGVYRRMQRVTSDADLAVLRAEVVALQAVLMAVFQRMVSERPELAELFCRAFDDAETILSGVAVGVGLDAPIETSIGALRIVEELRVAVIRNESVCA